MAARFWVGGSGTWDNSSTANWSATTGGASGASAPTSADTATFDANSGVAATVTVTATAVCSSCTVNKSDINLSLSGSPTFSGSLTLTTGTLTLSTHTLTATSFSSSNSNARTIDFGTGSLDIRGTSGTIYGSSPVTNMVVLGTPRVRFTTGAAGTRTINAGNPTQAQSISLYVTSGADTIAFGSVVFRTLDFTGFAGTIGNVAFTIRGDLTFSSGMTLTAGSSSTTFAGTSGIQQITTAGKTLDFPLIFNGIGGTFAFQDALTQGSTRAFTITNGTVQLKNSVTSTVGAFTTSGTNQKFLQSTLPGAEATLSQASGTVSTSYLTIQDINATGGATWNAYLTNNNVDGGNNTGWDFNPLQIGRYIYTRRKNKRILP